MYVTGFENEHEKISLEDKLWFLRKIGAGIKRKIFLKMKEEFLKKCWIYNYIKIVTDYIKR